MLMINPRITTSNTRTRINPIIIMVRYEEGTPPLPDAVVLPPSGGGGGRSFLFASAFTYASTFMICSSVKLVKAVIWLLLYSAYNLFAYSSPLAMTLEEL